MLVFSLIVTFLAAGVGLEWVARNVLALAVWRAMFHLTADYPLTLDEWPTLSLVVAARDEEANIESCLTSLLAQDYPRLEVIVVNDRSTDATGQIIRRLAEKDARVRTIAIDVLPEGWSGKNHAMQRGIKEAHGEWVLMQDADCQQVCPRTLRLAVQYAVDARANMLSLLPEHRYGSFWERYLLPVLTGVLMIWFRPSRVNDPRRREAFANGMFMLIRRETYEAIGTHEAVRDALLEDMEIARRVKARGLNLRVAPSTGLFTVRMYTSLAQIIRGWERIYIGVFSSVLGVTKALLVLISRGLTPVAACAIGWAMVLAGATPADGWLAAAIIGSVGLVAQLVMAARFFKYAKSPWIYGLTYPVACIMVAAVLIKAIFKLHPGGKITWRGTVYRVAQHVPEAVDGDHDNHSS
jgi:cellulose synthase/poly-beta-1,6-N-acetylglucosamine synthase-like glycosyltransferase